MNGIRRAKVRSLPRVLAGDGECGMTLTLRDSVDRVSDPENLNASVSEVFETMLGIGCEQVQPSPLEESNGGFESLTAVVGFGGILSGACVITCDESSARQIASRMTGMEFGSVDDVVKDAIGEICNMVAGAWKCKVPELAANCGLSVPAVITGHDYNLHVQSPEFRLLHVYRFDEGNFQIAIVCDGLL